tara:strand:+ start:3329 stop:3745 length:417 start_codon:yes stop_codon:yes gene_type:complete
MIVTNIDNPEYTPVTSFDTIPESWGGDTILIDNGNGKTQKKQYHLPVEPETPPTEYQALNKIEVITLLRAVSGMDDAGELAFRKDANLELFWMKWNNDVGNLIHRDHALTDSVLSAVVATGHITEPHKAGIFAAWPTV